MVQAFCILFPPVIAVVLHNYFNNKNKEKAVISIVIEYFIWVLLVNTFAILVLCLFFGYSKVNFATLHLSGKFILKYIALSFTTALVMSYIYSNTRAKITTEPISHHSYEKKGGVVSVIKNIISAIMIFATFLVLLCIRWLIGHFGLITPEKFLFQLKVPIKGTEFGFIKSFIIECIVVAFIFTIIFIKLVHYQPNKEYHLKAFSFKKNFDFVIFPLKAIKKRLLLVSTISLAASLIIFAARIDLFGFYIKALQNSPFIQENYADTRNVKLTFPEKKRNLILIFLESMENTYMSRDIGGAMNVNLIPELTQLAKENISFSNTDEMGGALPMPGTGWTIAAMVSHTTGLPLKIPIDGNSYGDYGKFLPGAVSLNDILEKQNYNQTLLVGSDSEFGGRKDYFTQHGNVKVLDYYWALERGVIPEDYWVWWGFEDKILYDCAREELTNLASQNKPFCFMLLTADTHHIGGYACELCQNEYDDNFSNVLNCASKQAFKFVEWIKSQDFYENTTVVLVGDHLSMDTKFFKNLNENYVRTTYNVFINSAVKTDNVKNRYFCSFDIFPTVLASIGVKIEGNRLGLGTNLFSTKPTLIEEHGTVSLAEELNKTSKFYNNEFVYP